MDVILCYAITLHSETKAALMSGPDDDDRLK